MIGYTLFGARDVMRHQLQLAQFSAKSADDFANKLALAEIRIVRRPRMYRLLQDGETRRYSFKINRTTYLIDYLIEPDRVVVVRIWHGRQHRPA